MAASRVLRAVRAIVLLVGSATAAFLLWLVLVWPPPSWYRTHWPSRTAFMRMRDANPRAGSDTMPLRYTPIAATAMSPWLSRAAVAGEDDAFYSHQGIDWRSMRQALGYRREAFAWAREGDRAELWRALGGAWSRREGLRGASTITQQLAKNLYLSPSRNPLRKVKEAVIAYRLEMALPKERIMELYLNVVELGPNLWGMEAASRHYFDRPALALTLDQSAMLVATLPHPLSSNPGYRAGRMRWRQQLILRKLRGERIEVPQEAEDPIRPQAADTLPPVVPLESIPPIPVAESLPVPDTTRIP